jgi:hypothetical protein
MIRRGPAQRDFPADREILHSAPVTDVVACAGLQEQVENVALVIFGGRPRQTHSALPGRRRLLPTVAARLP